MSVPIAGSAPEAGDVQMAFAATLVDEWARCGMTHAVVSPGSRSTPLAVALLRHPGMETHVRLDERSAAFTALGIGMASGHPAVMVTTSGTAAAELHAAVAEADLARVPLLVCTADRPPELRDIGAPQTIDQQWLFGRAVRWYADPGVADAAGRATWRSLASRSVAEAVTGSAGPGPVHLNLPFREPLLGDADRGGIPPGRPEGQPWYRIERVAPAPPEAAVDRIVEAARAGVRGVIVFGAGGGDPEVVEAASSALGWPVLAEPRSGLRQEGPTVIAAADGILRSDVFAAGHRPEFILKLGSPWVSKVVNTFLASVDPDTPVVAVVPWDQWVDPDRSITTLVTADPTLLCRSVIDRMPARPEPDGAPPGSAIGWCDGWRAAETVAQAAIDQALGDSAGANGRSGGIGGWTEPGLARRLFADLPAEVTLVSSSSMPVRDLEAFAGPRVDPPRVLANRGANGIDGVVSTAIGVALATGPTVALVGDLAFLHDVSALVRSAGTEAPCTVVVADNGGGGIFSFLPPASGLDPVSFETLFGTQQVPDAARVAAGFGIPVEEVGPDDGPEALRQALDRRLRDGGLGMVQVRLPDRGANVEIHADLNRQIVEAVDRGLAAGADPVGSGPPGQQGVGS
ncbi:MAG TPA: 2-succinyl-5-enolpyruvyl-6-hydroxy-3-cyclohexene-1-carboxylic-acid synthase [Acidimicrobiales bacterium]|jgi:2-succinyl-5-enolpyruvyl-6-hydroxy-3-cyclohexene-1-carboxylate synthase|nr:2-succinyl-5-enolpyruvyl-6-hydroxy-3-cyclohexene-1-carboxylic-acid synthase [Acidimicrobiales bacterium]